MAPAGALAGAPRLKALQLDVSTVDPVAFGTATLALTAVALGACYLSARRAARLPPLVARRGE
jgi:ABC-type lipoprotein release transport system permease subunit